MRTHEDLFNEAMIELNKANDLAGELIGEVKRLQQELDDMKVKYDGCCGTTI